MRRPKEGGKSLIGTVFDKVKTFKELTISISIVILIIGISIKSPVFLSAANIKTTALGLSTTGIIAIGVTIALIGGAFDLSVGSIMGLSAVLTVEFANTGLNIWLAVLLNFLICVSIGAINGILVGKIKLNGFITTYAVAQIARGIVYVITEGYSIRLPSGTESFQRIGNESILGGIPIIVFIFIVLAVVSDFLLRNSSLLRKVFYVGSNEKAAVLSGINSGNVKLWLHMGTAALASFAGILSVSRFGVASASQGVGIEMTVLSAAVIGGASLAGGVGTILGSVLGVIMLSIVNNALVLLNISVNWQSFVSGLILLVAIVIDYLSIRAKRRG